MSVYEELGVVPVINAWGTITEIGGSLLDERVVAAMSEASRSFVDVVELHRAGGRAVAAAFGVDGALLTSGAAAGISIAVAGCLTGTDSLTASNLPRMPHARAEVVMLAAHDSAYTQLLRLPGAEVVQVGTARSASVSDVLAQVGPFTRAFFYLVEAEAPGLCSLEELAAALHPLGIPIIVDAAGELPLPGGIKGLLDRGADLVIISGGKEIRGPQSSGVVLGAARLIDACAINAFPFAGIGRGMKLDKETIVGLVTAVKLFASRDEQAVKVQREGMLDLLEAALKARPDLEIRRAHPVGPGLRPSSIPRLLLRPLRGDAREIQHLLRHGSIPIAVGVTDGAVALNPQCVQPEEIAVVIAEITRVLDELAIRAPEFLG